MPRAPGGPATGGTTAGDEEKLREYYDLIERKMKPVLNRLLAARDSIQAKRDQYIHLRNNIQVLQDSKQSKLETLVNLGSEFYGKAEVADPSRIFVDVGLSLHVELTLDEATSFCRAKEAFLQRKADAFAQRATSLQADIKQVYEAMALLVGRPRGGSAARSPPTTAPGSA